jgi:hypothetical protein
MSPAMPKAPSELGRLAAPVVGEEAEAPFVVLVAAGTAEVVPVAVEVPVEVEEEATVEAPVPTTPTAVLRQLESELGRTVNDDENARAPVLSLSTMVKIVLA